MISLADAGGRIMYSYKEAAELAGFTARVHELISVFHDLDQSRYVRTMVSKKSSESASTTEVPSHLREFSLTDIRGVIKCGRDGIELNMVPVVTPGGDLLVKDLSFQIDPGMHLLCTGSNGVGKSAVMRIISGLWPLFRSFIVKTRMCLSVADCRWIGRSSRGQEHYFYPTATVLIHWNAKRPVRDMDDD